MLTFKLATAKNFMAVGAVPYVMRLDQAATTLISGENGVGKSTLLDILCYVLFNRAFRNINKPQLINSVNGKNCLGIVEFDSEGVEYRVVRGMKPAKFEIYQAGKLLNQPGSNLDYQRILEQQILKFSYKTFTQVVILGSTSFTPFMQLSSPARRGVIEDILGISVFSVMNQLLRERSAETKESLAQINSDIKVAMNRVKSKKELITRLSQAAAQSVDSIDQRLQETITELTGLKSQVDELDQSAQALPEPEQVDQRPVRADITALNTRLKSLRERSTFFTENEACPTCEQPISEKHKHHIQTELEGRRHELESSLLAAEQQLQELSARFEESEALSKLLQSLKAQRQELMNKASWILQAKTQLEADKAVHESNVAELESEQMELKTLALDSVKLVEKKKQLHHQQGIQESASALLKDSGIRSYIIQEYLPLINSLINKYLQVMDAYIQFELDDQFNETIRSRYRDNFTYDSFSEGEKMRLDLAILFTWRQIARAKNSVRTNLLIMDEVFDSSLDVAGVDAFITLMNQAAADGQNIFVISHKGDQLNDRFEQVIETVKEGNFTMLQQA